MGAPPTESPMAAIGALLGSSFRLIRSRAADTSSVFGASARHGKDAVSTCRPFFCGCACTCEGPLNAKLSADLAPGIVETSSELKAEQLSRGTQVRCGTLHVCHVAGPLAPSLWGPLQNVYAYIVQSICQINRGSLGS